MPQDDKKSPEESTKAKTKQIIEEAKKAGKKAKSKSDKKTDYQAIIDEMNDKVLRAAAEVQNVRRRAEIDIQKARHFSIESLAKDLLSVVDNLYHTTDNVTDEDIAKDEKLKAVIEGIQITKKDMLNVLSRHNIKRIDPLGEKFDHNLHQAISQVEDKNSESGTIIQVMQAGYIIKDRLLRPAMVVVAK